MWSKISISPSLLMLGATGAVVAPMSAHAADKAHKRPNILFCIADDATYEHWGAMGCGWVNTPSFDRVAREGVIYSNCYTPNAKSAPSRACLLTGCYSWQLGEAGNHVCHFPEAIPVFTDVLTNHGYDVAYTCKGWGPGDPGTLPDGSKRLLTGRAFNKRKAVKPTSEINPNDYAANFHDFLEEHDAQQSQKPWFFWYGPREPHRRYEYGSGVGKGNKRLDMIKEVPGFWPDCDTVRTDLLDYAYEIEHFDDHIGRMMQELEQRGELANTIIIITSDNGMPFPRAKGNNYEYSHHLPLVVMWKEGLKNPGRVEDGFVSFVDIAPTILNLAGITPTRSEITMEGQSFSQNITQASRKCFRSYTLLGRERHDNGRPNDTGYPIRGIRQGDWLYLWNAKADRWPAGNPETGYRDIDGSPTKTVILNMYRKGRDVSQLNPGDLNDYPGPDADTTYWHLSMGFRPEHELYNVKQDPYCLHNLAPENEKKVNSLRKALLKLLKREADPRMGNDPDVFDRYPYDLPSRAGAYERVKQGELQQEKKSATWINPTDYSR